jgi:hypothetical protein
VEDVFHLAFWLCESNQFSKTSQSMSDIAVLSLATCIERTEKKAIRFRELASLDKKRSTCISKLHCGHTVSR